MEHIKLLTIINSIISKVKNTNQIQATVNIYYSFLDPSTSRVEILFLVKDDKMREILIPFVKQEENVHKVPIIALSEETKEDEIFPVKYKELIKEKLPRDPGGYQPGEELFLFLDDVNIENSLLSFYKMYTESEVRFLVHIITKIKDKTDLIFLSDKINRVYDFFFYDGPIEEIKEHYGITSNLFGFLIDSEEKVRYILKEKSDFEGLVNCFKTIKYKEQFRRNKEEVFKEENKIELSKEKIEKAISNVTEIYNKGKQYFKGASSFEYSEVFYFKQNEEYASIRCHMQFTLPNQRSCKEFMTLVKPYRDQLPDKDEFQIIYIVDYRDHADITFKEGKKCNKCQKLIKKEDCYYICYFCKIEKKDYIICSSCFTEHNHPIVYVPIGGSKYLPDLQKFRSIQIEEPEPDPIALLIPLECYRCCCPINGPIYCCCQCRVELCEKCFKEFKNGENYIVDESQKEKARSYGYNAFHIKEHLEDHPMLITNDKWICEPDISWKELPYYENNPNDMYSYLYNFPKE